MSQHRKFGTFAGVFTPTILTILGVIMYLRLGWVVGTVGITGALLIIILSHIATITTGLSLATMATNVRVGAGGFYAFVSRSLGPEIGGSVGIPLYISQTLSISLYIMGFSEAWVSVFPGHDNILVMIIVLLCLLILSYVGAGLAIKVQYIIMGLIFISLFSFFLSDYSFSQPLIFEFKSDLKMDKFWHVFAIFFPAVTGIGAGVAMSGDLKNPKKNLPFGILSAVIAGFILYITVAIWYEGAASTGELISNNLIMAEKAKWKWFVLIGVMGATLSSALGSIVGSPRILQALAQDRVLPLSKIFSMQSQRGDPRNAVLFTGVLVLISFFIGDLNYIAGLLTMFFLISYSMINFTVFIEKFIGIPSFRPTFNIPIFIPLIGAVWCIVIMFLINPVFAIVSLLLLFVIYILYVKRDLKAPFGDVRSGIFTAIGEWAVKTSMRLPQHMKSWKPNVLAPVEDPQKWYDIMDFIKNIISPSGTLRLISVNIVKKGIENRLKELVGNLFGNEGKSSKSDQKREIAKIKYEMDELVDVLKKENLFIASTVVDSYNFIEGISIIIQTIKGMFFPPNIIFLTISEDKSKDSRLEELIAISIREKLGIIILAIHPEDGFKNKKKINLWLRVGSPNVNLAILTALQLERNWNCNIRLLSAITREEERSKVLSELNSIVEYGRLNRRTEVEVLTDSFIDVLADAPQADLNIFGMSGELSCNKMHDIVSRMNTSCLFIMDSGYESFID
ncbi:amino acid permease [Spirochaetota bacterium]